MKHFFSGQFATVLFIAVALSFSSCSKKSNPNPAPPPSTPPTNGITSISVNQGPYNTAVVVTGVGFSAVAADNHVFFNGKEATITAATTTQLSVSVPLTAGTGNITVKIKDGTVLTGPVFTYQLSMLVTTFAGTGVAGFKNGNGIAASFNQPANLKIDAAGNLIVADQSNHAIRKITPDGTVTTIAGTGSHGAVNGIATAASFKDPTDLAIDNAGNIYVADEANYLIRKITPAGVVSTFAGSGSLGASDGTGSAASFDGPTSIGIDAAGFLYVTDSGNSMVRKISPAGVVTTFAGSIHFGLLDGTGTAAKFNFLNGLTLDNAGNIYVTDLLNYDIRKITSAGVVTTLAGSGKRGSDNGIGTAASFTSALFLAADKNGNLYVTEPTLNIIRKIDPTGVVTNFAGTGTVGAVDGPLATASFNNPAGIAIDAAGNIYVTDAGDSLIRKIGLQ